MGDHEEGHRRVLGSHGMMLQHNLAHCCVYTGNKSVKRLCAVYIVYGQLTFPAPCILFKYWSNDISRLCSINSARAIVLLLLNQVQGSEKEEGIALYAMQVTGRPPI